MGRSRQTTLESRAKDLTSLTLTGIERSFLMYRQKIDFLASRLTGNWPTQYLDPSVKLVVVWQIIVHLRFSSYNIISSILKAHPKWDVQLSSVLGNGITTDVALNKLHFPHVHDILR